MFVDAADLSAGLEEIEKHGAEFSEKRDGSGASDSPFFGECTNENGEGTTVFGEENGTEPGDLVTLPIENGDPEPKKGNTHAKKRRNNGFNLKKDPTTGRILKGSPGGPGRPRKSPAVAASDNEVKEALESATKTVLSEEAAKGPTFEQEMQAAAKIVAQTQLHHATTGVTAVLDKLKAMSEEGNLGAMQLYLKYTTPPPKPSTKINRPDLADESPANMAAEVAKEMLRGGISAEDANLVTSVLAQSAKVSEAAVFSSFMDQLAASKEHPVLVAARVTNDHRLMALSREMGLLPAPKAVINE